MKQIIYSTGFFETSLTIEPPEERSDYNAPSLKMVRCQAIVQTPKYEIRKTSQCLTKYVIEDGDLMILKDLNAKSNQALKDLVDKLITYHECHIICNKAKRFREMYKKREATNQNLMRVCYMSRPQMKRVMVVRLSISLVTE